jgi:alpha-ketoglutarate-dependent taurine dioxygenase
VNIEIVGNSATSIAVAHASGGKATDVLRDWINEAVREYGAAMIRGLDLSGVEKFHEVVSQLGSPLLDSYAGGDTPRTTLSEGVFTSTDYPAQYPISQHNEMSYASAWPQFLYFGCLEAASTGGATPISNGSALLESLPDSIRARFESKGVLYQQCLHDGDGPGRSWQETFETTDQDEVEAFLRSAGAAFEWLDEGGIRVRQVRPSVRTHPATGKTVWFNQAEQWHPSSIPGISEEVVDEMAEDTDELPRWSSFADGDHFSPSELEAVRDAAEQTSVGIPWRAGDLMMIDNMAVLHGRQPYTGTRKTVVAMS